MREEMHEKGVTDEVHAHAPALMPRPRQFEVLSLRRMSRQSKKNTKEEGRRSADVAAAVRGTPVECCSMLIARREIRQAAVRRVGVDPACASPVIFEAVRECPCLLRRLAAPRCHREREVRLSD